MPIHAHLLPTGRNAALGRVLFWGRTDPNDQNVSSKPYIWKAEGTTALNAFITNVPPVGFNAFCSGHTFLADGKLLVAGGHNGMSSKGLDNAAKYDPQSNTWTSLQAMNAGRWYPTITALPNGDALVISGTDTGAGDPDLTPQILHYNPNTWTGLPNGDMNVVSKYYPFVFVAPPDPATSDKRVFLAGPATQTKYLTVTSPGGWSALVGNLLNGRRNWGSAVMYEPGKILVMGGTTCGFYDDCMGPPEILPTSTSAKINLKVQAPQWSSASDMATGRRKLHTATILANGKVLVSGGRRDWKGPKAAQATGADAALECEIWDGNSWSARASLPKYRGYHSIALLLPDATVLSAGGDHAGGGYDQSHPDDYTAEIFKPGYFFLGDNLVTNRPTIVSPTASTMNYAPATFTVYTPRARNITKVNLVGVGSVTHGFNMGQRFLNLPILPLRTTDTSVTVNAPLDENEAPPGYYMLFIFDDTPNAGGVPSVAKFVKVNLP